jgi:hypothetical protein
VPLVILVLLCASSPRAAEPWFVAYERALESQEQGEWRASIAFLEDALAERPEPRMKARTYGLRFINYLPYYRLGRAYFELGEGRKAKEYLEKSTALQETDTDSPERISLEGMLADLSRKHAQPSAKPGKPLAKRETAAARDSLPLVGGLPWYVYYENGLAYLESEDWYHALENLKESLALNRTPKAYARTYGMWFVTYSPYYYLGLVYYRQKLWDFAVEYLQASEKFAELRDRAEDRDARRAMLDEARRAGGTKPGKKKPAAGARELLNRELAEAIRLYNSDRLQEAAVGFRSILRLDPYNSVAKSYLDKLRKDSAEPATGAASAHGAYLAGIAAYYRGEYASAAGHLRAAEPACATDPKLFAFLGAACAGQYVEGGRTDDTLLQQAREAFAHCLDLSPGFTPEGGVFTDDAVSIFAAVRQERGRK